MRKDKKLATRLRAQAARARIFMSKTPKSETPHVGVELEFCSPLQRTVICDALVHAKLEKHVQLKEDGSVTGNESLEDCGGDLCAYSWGACECCDFGHELCVLATEAEFPKVLKRVLRVLKACDAYVNSTCGLHVHLDMRRRNVKRSFHNLVSQLPWLTQLVAPSRLSSVYCERNYTPDLALHFVENGTERYWMVNPESWRHLDTLEVRLHHGSLNAEKIQSWVGVLIRVANAKVYLESSAALPAALKLPKKLKSWVDTRGQKLGKRGKHATAA